MWRRTLRFQTSIKCLNADRAGHCTDTARTKGHKDVIPRRFAPRDDSLAFRPRRVRAVSGLVRVQAIPSLLQHGGFGAHREDRRRHPEISTKNQESSPGSLRVGSSELRSDLFDQLHPLHPYSLRLWGRTTGRVPD